MASIHDEPEISPEEEEQMKKMARYRDHLIFFKLCQFKIGKGDRISFYNHKITQYDWLLLPPSTLN
ncbi:hypothetical protein MKW92_023777 [Papaver armeniacum]|nr:hypothetical protein MKW92_023777 [Papaver armeniacum]